MPKKSIELREKRAKLIADARGIYTEAEKANRDPNAEERSQFDTIMKDADDVRVEFERLERLETAEREMEETRGRRTDAEIPGENGGRERATSLDHRATPEYRSAFNSYLIGGFSEFGPAETRALQADNDITGGALVAPMQFLETLIKGVDDMVHIRQLATKVSVTTADSLGVPTLDTDPSDAEWTSELKTGTEDSAMRFGKRELKPSLVAKRTKVSQKLLRLTSGRAETIVNDRLTYKFGITQEKAFLTGGGAGKPLGVFTASDDGIPTSRDVSTGNTSTAITGDGLIAAKYSLKQQYQNSEALRWMFHRNAVEAIVKLKSNDNQYLWQPGLQAGQPDLLLKVPVLMSEYAPNTFTTGLYVGMIGDFSHYWIADATNLTIQRLVELYAETGQVGFIGRWESDGMPVLGEAFARVKLA